MEDWANAEYGNFDPERSDQQKILEDKLWVRCRICRSMFLRIRLTARFCNTCQRAFCEGEHGSFTGRGPAVCVRCLAASGDLA